MINVRIIAAFRWVEIEEIEAGIHQYTLISAKFQRENGDYHDISLSQPPAIFNPRCDPFSSCVESLIIKPPSRYSDHKLLVLYCSMTGTSSCFCLQRLLFIPLVLLLLSTSSNAQLKRVLDPIAAKIEPDKKITYKTSADRELKLHIFEPKDHQPSSQRPVLLIIHGGGWTGGEPRWFYPVNDRFRDLGMLTISIEYRLLRQAKGNTVFDCIKDGRSAVRYVRDHAEELWYRS